MKQQLWKVISAFLALSALGFGCSEEAPPVRPSAAPAAPASPVGTTSTEKLEVPSIFAKTTDEYSYNPVGKRDPFKPYKADLVQDVSLPRSPLEQWELENLRLTAIVWGISNPRALVYAPDGQSYIVRKDMRMGKNRGRVSRITRRELFVKEEFRDPTGKLVVRESMLDIRPKEEEEAKLKMKDE